MKNASSSALGDFEVNGLLGGCSLAAGAAPETLPIATGFPPPLDSKENVAISQLLALLETRYAMRVLWALKDGHPQTFRLLQDSVGGITPLP